MASILVGTNDLRAGLISVLVHACVDPELPGLCRIRLDVGKENVTVTATDRFTAGLALVSVFSHLGYDLEETDIPWVEIIDLSVDDAQKILSIFKAGKDKADEPEFLLRIETTDTHVTVTDSSGMIDGRALKLPRLAADDAFPDLTDLFAKVHHGKPSLLEDMAVGGKLLARFKAAAACYREALLIEATTSSRSLTIRCGESFLGVLMPVHLDDEARDKQKAWRDAWTERLPLPAYANDSAES
ncbi:hypothetical protein L1080_004505 [Rhodococcus sp. MSC1_016]|jgi:hypothetical protein|uniref:hypothetical protein n=1 Tax=Rhodococcus sp. MSC1_016 TaxID=2909266 RepID=UPI0020309786|nr:hypothetical protein [Rhodococcus sp. MSC1_016]